MANPAQVATQVRFALSQLPAHNAHHTFEEICRHLTGQFICSNVLPATGPVSAGGIKVATMRRFERTCGTSWAHMEDSWASLVKAPLHSFAPCKPRT